MHYRYSIILIILLTMILSFYGYMNRYTYHEILFTSSGQHECLLRTNKFTGDVCSIDHNPFCNQLFDLKKMRTCD